MTTMTTLQDLRGWRGRPVVGPDGTKIGKLADIYLDEATGQPEWLTVTTGLFGSRVSFVPLAGASGRDDAVAVPFTKDQVKEAPHAEADGELSQDDEERLYRHYGMSYSYDRSGSGLPGGGAPAPRAGTGNGGAGGPGHDTSGPNTDRAMTRSEEELRVGKTLREAGKVRLRKWVDTERVSQTVPVAREQVRVEREPITDANVDRALDGPAISEEEHEVTLREEEVVAAKQAVPKERVRLDKDVVTDQRTVSEDLRKERIEVEGDGARR